MTEQRKKLIDKFQSWLDTDPRKQIIAAVCANIAEEYADKQLRLHFVSQQRELLIDCVKECLKDKDSITVEQQVDNYLRNKSINCG